MQWAAVATRSGATRTPEQVPPRDETPNETPHLLITAGGGEDGYDLLRGVVAAMRGPLRDRSITATLVAGPLMNPAQIETLSRMDGRRSGRAIAAALGRSEADFGPDYWALVALLQPLNLLLLGR